MFNVEVPASEDAGKDSVAVTGTVVDKLEGKLGVAPGTIRADAVTTVRKTTLSIAATPRQRLLH